MTRELLEYLFKNTIINNFSKEQKIALLNLKQKVSNLKEGEKMEKIEFLSYLESNNLTITNVHDINKICFRRIESKILFFEETKNKIQIFNSNISHPIDIVAINIVNNKLIGYSIHFTTKNYGSESVVNNVKLFEILPLDKLEDFEKVNIKGYKKLLQGNPNLIRLENTWVNCLNGNKSLIKVIELNDGRIQYISPVLIKYEIENGDYKEIFINSTKQILPLDCKLKILEIMQGCELWETIEPLNNNFYSTVLLKDLIFLKSNKTSYNFDLNDPTQFKDWVLTSSNMTTEEYLHRNR